MSIEENKKSTVNSQEISTFTTLTDRYECMNRYFTEIFLNDECIGECDIFVSFDDEGDIENAYCKSLMIYPEYRNKGYGTEFLRRVSCYYNGLYICPDNKNAERLYARIGYECVSPEEFESELDTYDKMYFIQPFENESNGKFSPTEIFDTEEECVNMEKVLNLDKFVKALIKSVGLKKAKEVRYTIQGVNVFFEYKESMYKCYTPQSKLYKLSGQRFNLITWRDLKKESDEKSDDKSDVVYTARPPPESSLLKYQQIN